MFPSSLLTFAQTAEDNVRPLTQEETEASALGGGVLIFLILLSLVELVFWILSLVHLIKNPTVPNRVLWIVLVVLLPIASFVYYFGPRRSFNKGGGSPTPNPLPAVPGAAQPASTQPQPATVDPVATPSPTPTPSFTASQPPVETVAPSPVVIPQAPVQPSPVTPPTSPVPTPVPTEPVTAAPSPTPNVVQPNPQVFTPTQPPQNSDQNTTPRV